MGILTAGEILVLLLLHALIRGFQITGSHLFPPLPLAITLLLLGAGTAFSGKQDTAVLRKYLRKAACIAGCVFLLEVLVFHITGFTTQKPKRNCPFPPQKSAMRKRLLSTTRARSPLPATAP